MGPETELSTAELRAARGYGYDGARLDVLALVPPGARTVLDLGCSTGALGAEIKARQEATVVGVEIDPAYAVEAEGRLDRVVRSDVEAFVAERPPEAPFDCLICADVLEHLVDPWATFGAAASWLAPGGTAIVSVPNVLFYRAVWRVLRERRWPRDDVGTFDRTHLRWFSLRDARDLVAGAGLEVVDDELRLWARGPRHRRFLEGLERTPARPFLAGQHVVVGRRP
jgi:SAM-dependent methyltransferase